MSHHIIAFGKGVKKHFSVRSENEILSKIDRIAADEDRSRGAVVRRIIQQFFFKGGIAWK